MTRKPMQMRKNKIYAAKYKEILARHGGNAREALNTELLVSEDIDRTHEELLNYGWGKLYPGMTDWEYPGQVINHLWAEIEFQRNRAEAAEKALRESVIVIGEPYRGPTGRIIKTISVPDASTLTFSEEEHVPTEQELLDSGFKPSTEEDKF
jgi:hypothetical protein